MNTCRKINRIVCAGFLFFLCASCTAPASKAESTGISVTGTGIVSIKPDTARIRLAVVTEDNEAAKAASKNAELTDAVIQAVQKAGIGAEDTATRDYRVYRRSRYNPQTGATEYGSYGVSNNLTVTVRNIADTGKIIDAALQAGANELSAISFYARDTSAAYDQARTQAFMHAQNAAHTLCAAAGKKLGSAIFIEEYQNGSAYRNSVVNYALEERALKMSSAATPISAGETDVSVALKVVFDFK